MAGLTPDELAAMAALAVCNLLVGETPQSVGQWHVGSSFGANGVAV